MTLNLASEPPAAQALAAGDLARWQRVEEPEAPETCDFDRLQALGQEALDQERMEEALGFYRRALTWAEERRDQTPTDLAFCNVCAVNIQLRAAYQPLTMEEMQRLREILMRNEDGVNCRLAAYNLSRVYEHLKESRKGLFYARIALDRSNHLARPDWIASSHNQIGNLLVMQSFFENGAGEYASALALLPARETARRAQIGINVAYCHLMLGRRGHAFELLYSCLRTLRREGVQRGQMFAHLDLCYCHLEVERYRDALRHGLKSLALAEQLGEDDTVKNSLYLVGQATHLLGNDGDAEGYFSRLQERFYPGSSGIPEFLMAIDVRKMINLRA